MEKDVNCVICKLAKPVDIGLNLFHCKSCGTVFNFNHTELEYNDSYFLSDYKKQYGKTYLEDFDNIYNSSKKRITRLFKKLPNSDRSKLKILDIGSALGFFLKAAEDSGVGQVKGIEISKYASNYCKNDLQIDVIQSSFESIKFDENFDIISAWYFIEHNKNVADVITKIYNILNNGGVFAFSVPSSFGPLFKFNIKKWIETHPVDHSIDFTPKSIKLFLKQIGFTSISIYPAGIHPERVMNPKSLFYKIFKPLYKIYSNIFAFSDTIEVYAKK